MPFMQVQDAVELIRMEYTEMPGMQLTFWQVQRLLNLSEELCDRALGVLTGSGFLRQTPDGRYLRAHPGEPTVASVAALLRYI
jgi:hypothetical protein